MIKRFILYFLGILIITSFSPFKKHWVKTKKENFIVYTRPIGYTKTNSPDTSDIRLITNEGIESVKEINEFLGVNFNSAIKIYLFNYDEAEKEIGTKNGGGANVDKRIIYFAFDDTSGKDMIRNKDIFIGVHEYVHIVTFATIGQGSIRLFVEGYANAIDGHYGSKIINGITVATPIEDYLSLKKIKKPSELLDSDNMFEGYFYPQSGYFIKWLFKEYSITTVNKLFVLPRLNFEKEFEVITGDSFEKMENNYLKYCEQNIK